MYSHSSHGLILSKLLSLLLVPWVRGNSRVNCFACATEVQKTMYCDSSHGLVPREVLSLLLVPWERGEVKTEVFAVLNQSAGGHVF